MSKYFFPESIKCLPVWILWKLEPDKSGRLTKVPYSAKYDGRASSTNENTWSTFENTMSKYEDHSGEYDGIGIMLSTKYQIVFIDIDHCISYEDGSEDPKLSPTAEDILNHMESQFIELSQSGTGVHILAVGDFEKNFKNSETGVEMYKEKRFVAMTGKALAENEPHWDPENIMYIYNKYKATQKGTKRLRKAPPKREVCLCLDDKKIIERASDNAKFKKLYVGDWSEYGSQSEGDLAMCSLLAFWTDCDPEAIDRIFRETGLYREKWEREDYRSETIRKACDGCEETLSEYSHRQRKEEIRRYEQSLFSKWACNS